MDAQISILVRKTLEGDLTAFVDLMNKYKDSVFSLVWSHLKDPPLATKVTEEVFVKVHQSLNMLGDFDQFSRWLARMTLAETGREAPREYTGSSSFLQHFHQSLSNLSESHQQVLLLKFLGKASYRQIGEMMDLPINTVRGIIFRGASLLSSSK